MSRYLEDISLPVAMALLVLGPATCFAFVAAPFLGTLAAIPGLAQRVSAKGLLRGSMRAARHVIAHRREIRNWTTLSSNIVTSFLLCWVILVLWLTIIAIIAFGFISPTSTPPGRLLLLGVSIAAFVLIAALARDTLIRAGAGALRCKPFAAPRGGTEWPSASIKSMQDLPRFVSLRWPHQIMHICDRRGSIAIARLATIYRYLSLPTACFVVVVGMADGASRTSVPSLLVEGIASAATARLIISYIWERRHVPISRLRLQLDMVHALAEKPSELHAFKWLDPLGSHRALLYGIAQQLRSEAHRIERRVAGNVLHPYAVLLRAAARSIDNFLGSASSVETCLSAEIEDVLSYTIALIAGPRDNAVRTHLAKLVSAFNDDGSPDPELVIAAPGVLARTGSRLYTAIDRTSALLKALSAIAIIVTLVVLLSLGRVQITNLPTWKP